MSAGVTPLESRWAHLSLQFGDPMLLGDYDAVVWYDGPCAMFATIDGQRVFGAGADEIGDNCVERWVFAPVTPEEEAAIRGDDAPLRAPLQKESAIVADIDWRSVPTTIRAARVDGRLLDDDKLPAPDARLRTRERTA